MAKKVERIWMRMGDQGEYEAFDSPWDAGNEIGMFYAEHDQMPDVKKYGRYGVEVDPGFLGPYNYVSLFWGDDDAQPTNDTTSNDIKQFISGLSEGAGLPLVKPRIKKAKKKVVKRARAKKTTVGISGQRGLL